MRHYLELAGLWDEVKDRLHAPAARLSVGQQQRLCLARGLAVEPEVILGDEPTSALDPISAQHIEKRLLELKEQYTIVLVTHILRQARRLADHVVFMYMGDWWKPARPKRCSPPAGGAHARVPERGVLNEGEQAKRQGERGKVIGHKLWVGRIVRFRRLKGEGARGRLRFRIPSQSAFWAGWATGSVALLR